MDATDLAAIPLPDRYIAMAAGGVEAALEGQGPDGGFRSAWAGGFHPSAQSRIWTLAFLYRTSHRLNPFLGDERLREAAVRCGDFLTTVCDERGRLSYNQRGLHVTAHADQWLLHAWMEAYRLLGDDLGPERAARWREVIRGGAATVAAHVSEWSSLAGEFHSRSFGTSPNHAMTQAAFVHRAGMVFDNPEWTDLPGPFVRRFLKLQDADGCWPEYAGPVVNYAMVTLAGLGQYYEGTGDPQVRRAVERTIDFLAHAHFPDGGPIAVLDGRQQGTGPSAWGHFALSLTEQGRALADLLTRNLLAHHHVDSHRLVESYIHWHTGPAGALPMDSPEMTHRFATPAGVGRAGPWAWALSGIVTPRFEAGRFSLDRQSLIELFHDGAGRVLGGANCKNHPEAATFGAADDPRDCVPVVSAIDEEVRHLRVGYQRFDAALTARAVSAQCFEVTARLRPALSACPARFRLQPAARHGQSPELDGARRELGDDDWSRAGVRELRWGNVAISFDAPATVWWPMRGYNPYSGDTTYEDLSAARLIAEIDLTEDEPARTVRITVAG